MSRVISSGSSLLRHYAALGLRPGASRSEVENAYRLAALRTHPDRGGSTDAFSTISTARKHIIAALDRGPGGDTAYPGLDGLGSVRMSNHAGSTSDEKVLGGVLGAVVLPTAVGLVVGMRLLLLDRGNETERAGLVRAGGNSRVVLRAAPSDDTTQRPA